MAKALRVVGTVAAVVALTFAIPGVGTAIGASIGVSISAGTAATIATVASVTASVATAGAAALQKKPGALGAINQVVIGNNMAIPLMVGRTYTGGNQVYDNSGGTENRYRFNVNVLSAAGPIENLESFLADYATVNLITDPDQGAPHLKATGFYSGFLWSKRQLGTRPETAALVDGNTPMPEWGSANKLSGYAAYLVTMKFDKDAKRYAGGVPQFGYVAKGVKVYDPRKDSTYPGGSGSQRWDDESTWAYGSAGTGTVAQGENPALHALAYARGRFIEKNADGTPKTPPIKIIGCGFPMDAVDLPAFVEAANLCDANGWTCGGMIYEAPGISKWENLKRFCQSFASLPVIAGGRLTLKLSAPRPSLFTLTVDDLAEGECSNRAMKPFQERRNSIVPRFRSETHRWEYVQGARVTVPTYLAEDGELRTDEVQYDLVQDKDQAAELAAYDLVNGREFGPIILTCKPRLMRYRPGEAGTLVIPELGLNGQKAMITARQVDPAAGTVTLTFESETDAKHDFALGRTGSAPPTPVIRTTEEVDTATGDLSVGATDVSQLIAISFAKDLTFSVNAPVGGAASISVSAHNRVYTDKTVTVAASSGLAASADPGDLVLIFYDDPNRAGGAVTYQTLVVPGAVGPTEGAALSTANPYRHFVGSRIVPSTGASAGGTDAGSGGGGGGWYNVEN